MDLQNFSQLLGQLKNPSNEARKAAEEIYNRLDSKLKVVSLLQIINSADPANPSQLEIALFAAVLLRRVISSKFKEFYSAFSPDDRKAFRSQILHLLSSNICREPNVMKKVCDTITQVMRNIANQDDAETTTWKELQEFVFNALSGQENHLKQCALIILADYPSLFGEEGRKRLNQIKITLIKAAMDSAFTIKKLGAVALMQFIMDNSDDEKDTTTVKMFQDCMERIYPVVEESIKQSDTEALKYLIDLAEVCPKLFRQDILAVFDFGISTMVNAEYPDDVRQLGMELLVTLCEHGPQIVRKHAEGKVPQFVLSMLKLMTELEDDPEWLTSDENIAEDEDSNSYVAESSIDRAACGLGGKVMLRPLLAACYEMLKSQEWNYRSAALMALSATGEGLNKSMEKNMDEIVGILKSYMVDPHPRVRYAACNCFGQLSTDFQPNFQKKYKQVVLDCLLKAISSDPEPRVQSHAVAAMINFTEDCDVKILVKFLDPILQVLYGALENKFKEFQATGRKLVLENVITEISSIADKVEEKFAPYYDKFMPYLKFIAEHMGQKDFRMLRGKAIECISLIGMCVPKEKFFQDANEVMQILLKTQTKEVEADTDDVSQCYYISAWGRICSILGKDFAVYLPMVMPPVVKAATQKAEFNVVSSDEVKDHEEEGWQFIGDSNSEQQVGIKTSGLEEKAEAIDTLKTYATELKEAFMPYLESTLQLMIDNLSFFMHEGVRQNAAAAIPALLTVAKTNPPPYLLNMWNHTYPALFEALKDEADIDSLGEKLGALADSLAIVGPEALTSQQIDDIFSTLEADLEEYFLRADERSKKQHDEDYDEEMQESLNEDAKNDYYLISRISDLVHRLLKVYGPALLPRFEKFLNPLMKLGAMGRPYQELQWVICTFDSLIQFGGEKAAVYKALFVPLFKIGVRHQEPTVRQASAFGWGLMAQYCGEHLLAECIEVFPTLIQHINAPDSRNEDNDGPTDNCISTIVRFIKYQPRILEAQPGLTVDILLGQFLSWLPVISDPDETPVIYDFFADLIEQNNPVVLGQNYANLPRIFAIIAEAFEKEALLEDEEGDEPRPPPHANDVYNRLVGIVQHIQQDAALFQKIVTALPEEQQKALSNALSNPPRKSLSRV